MFFLKQLNKRQSGRLAQQHLMSSHGAVLDLSRGGLRLMTMKKPPDQFVLRLLAIDGPLDLAVAVTWIRRRGFRQFEVGVAFLDVAEEQLRHLTQIAVSHSMTMAA